MELITTHTHTCFTNHGEGTVEELVSAAVAAGVSTIAVTEHYPMTATFDPDRYLSMPAERMGEYLAAVEAARVCGRRWTASVSYTHLTLPTIA